MKLSIQIIFIFLGFNLAAQESVNTSGGETTGSGGTTSFSLGQVVYTTKSSGSGTLNEGVHQTYIVIDSTASVDDKSVSLEMKVFPNPTTNIIQLTIENLQDEQLTYVLRDVTSKSLLTGQVSSVITQLDFSAYERGVYFLSVIDSSGAQRIFKIIKQ